jgi:hypothetical protein
VEDGELTSEAPIAAVAAPGEDEGPAKAPVGAVLLSLAGYAVFRFLLDVVRLPVYTPGWVLSLAFVVIALGAIGLPIAAIATLIRLRLPAAGSLGAAAAGLLLWGACALLGGMAGAAVPAGVLADLGKIVAASGVGMTLATALRDPNLLLPAGAFAAFADFVVVRWGTVHRALQPGKGQKVLQAVSAHIPSVHPGLPHLTIGPADFLFLGILLACAARFRFGLERNAWVLALVLAVSLLLVPYLQAIPALAPMCIAFLALNWRKMSLTKQEVVSTLVVLGVVGALFYGYFAFIFR